MSASSVGDLVTVAGGGPELDGIVFDVPSREKVVVALVDPARGPGFRTVHPRVLTERAEAGPDDAALDRLIRRTPVPSGRRTGSDSGPGGGRSAGHSRGAAHRATGK
ncbi:hypothetical protein NBH00_06535 [Paraconexibacter antarcticus]|uniref:Uncharacterized protein n=1 Tax=Paraconexibacter antarcticus TaxID=2949664 RepID=A0ABY5DV27_9ACTN|nr:hypothetical protein [Paraconexibacter antarcticus]UTI65868.1 hypothetical protein NBH00_06535 [Paraconexibacter antarcticus]